MRNITLGNAAGVPPMHSSPVAARSGTPPQPLRHQTHCDISSEYVPANPRFPLFVTVGGTPFTSVYLIQQVQRLTLLNGIAGNFTGHSFRRAAATWASRQGLGADLIQMLARWKSEAYLLVFS